MTWPIDAIRSQFPGLQRTQDGRQVVFLDGPAGSQVPEKVVDAVARYLRHTNCNRGAAFSTAVESDSLINSAHQALADFVGTDDPDCIIFGPNMTSLTLQLSRALSRKWQSGDEIIVTRLDHDANVTPWVLAARDRGVIVRHVGLNPGDWTLDQQDFQRQLSDRTRLVAIGYASNATGTINPVHEMTRLAHEAGALVFIDAVHYAPHGRIRVTDIDCDFLAVSAYKFFGPHTGVLWGRRSLLESLQPYKLRPAPDSLPGRWMTGTQSHESICGSAAAVEYLCSLDDASTTAEHRSLKLDRAFARIRDWEHFLAERFLEGLKSVPGLRLWGITDPKRLADRVPTFSFTLDGHENRRVAEAMAVRGLFVWHGNHYALPFTETAGLEPGGTVRVGALHYNTPDEVDRLISGLHEFQTNGR